MNFSYYPGCTLKNKAQDLDRYARLSAEKLGIHLEKAPPQHCHSGISHSEKPSFSAARRPALSSCAPFVLSVQPGK